MTVRCVTFPCNLRLETDLKMATANMPCSPNLTCLGVKALTTWLHVQRTVRRFIISLRFKHSQRKIIREKTENFLDCNKNNYYYLWLFFFLIIRYLLWLFQTDCLCCSVIHTKDWLSSFSLPRLCYTDLYFCKCSFYQHWVSTLQPLLLPYAVAAAILLATQNPTFGWDWGLMDQWEGHWD